MSFELNGVEIEDTFAEGFSMWGSRIIITAVNRKWANIAATKMTGFATSVIACDCEAGIEREIPPEETPDGRPGTAVMVFGFSRKRLSEPMLNRIGQCVLTCPTTAIFNGLHEEQADAMLDIGKSMRFFGDGYQVKMRMGDGWLDRRRFWRIPVMEGEFLVEEKFGARKAVAGGNFLVMGETEAATLEASERAIEAIHEVPLVITPFPGGLCRSGSKVGSTYAFLRASTNTPFCPAIKHTFPESKVPEGVNSVIEVVLNGLDEESVKEAMATGIRAATEVEGVKWITAVNFAGKLGKYQIGLRDALGGG
ncbi:MAG: formylmethanofuran--tetrahydromethanopterin N-formyltransferase [Candidatus Bathyarchaeota archaeon]|nr:MAG: formylmethanofuran--tetrahydromethanopterin N-formyltransferase [Candidatus Bathyarchaeota archaeon]